MNTKKEQLCIQTDRRHIFLALRRGLIRVITEKRCFFIFWGAFLIECVLAGTIIYSDNKTAIIAFRPLQDLAFLFVLPVLIALPLYVMGKIPHSGDICNNLIRAGIVNAVGEPPYPIDLIERGGVIEITFESRGIRASDVLEKLPAVESALNLLISRVDDGRDFQKFYVLGVRPTEQLSDRIIWDEALRPQNPFEIMLGVSRGGYVSISLLKTPHWLIGATTGYGKTSMLLLIYEQIKKLPWDIYIVDWKGGVDFSQSIQNRATFITDYDELIAKLLYLKDEIEWRRDLFNGVKKRYPDMACNNTEEYRKLSGRELSHHVVLIDEASMVFDSSGADKDIKSKISEVLRLVDIIGRIGRAYGIHLIIFTQRPDVNSVPGSLKANLDGRICGHMADITSSMVVIDNGDGAKLPAIPGRFIVRQNGVEQIFQAFSVKQDSV